jgi:uncharacterized protein YceH (UPF0502 family)
LLEGLTRRPEGALVAQLAREPGRRDSRWAQLFEELPASVTANETPQRDEPAPRAAASAAPVNELVARIATLEAEVAALRAEIAALKNPA